jgi:hypothetical protein
VDIEGAEYDLFYSLEKDDFDKIDSMLIEYHLGQNKTVESDVNKLTDYIESFGFICEVNTIYNHGGFIFCEKINN